MRQDTRQRKKALAGLRAISGQDRMLGTLVRVISSGKQALDAVMLEMGRMVAESVMLIERCQHRRCLSGNHRTQMSPFHRFDVRS